MPLRSHGSVPDPVPLDLSAPSSAHVDMSPEAIPGPSHALDVVITEWGITAGELATGELSTEDRTDDDVMAAQSWPQDLDLSLESKVDMMLAKMDLIIEALHVVGNQQQWVTDQVTNLGPLFAQLDHMFAGAKTPADIFKGLLGMRGKVIPGDSANGE